jgi:hypothetical protein
MKLMTMSLDLINRQKAEIDRLKKDNEYILMQHKFQRRPSGDCWNDVIEKAKDEAIKEFARRVKATFPPRDDARCTDDDIFTLDSIDRIMNDMLTGEKT